MSHTLEGAAAQAGITALRPSARLPVLFVGHGSPMNAIEDNTYRRSWQQLGQQLLARAERPQLVLCISAHWITQGQGSWLTGMAQPRTIHDFGGFPDALFAQQYPAPGAPVVAQQLASQLHMPHSQQALGVDADGWGLDHGTWSVLKPMFPAADIPVVQLSIDYRRPPAEHFALGQQLQALRERGVLIVGSGNVVHNLRALQRTQSPLQAYDWAIEFDQMVTGLVERGDLARLGDFQQLGTVAQMAHPTYDHYLPLLYAAGAVHPGEVAQFFNADFQMAAISMRSMVWGA
ncbi:4,5-DOPA dioxygenase extradiol [Comamonas aquatica]|uniref:4,5-DOPA dioxygenase extradiol n=1 Tax=Comamonas aquatica TaxID=225991 RepID=A0AA42W3J9_9BURK|nr:4,5-DOPA dioxygenase extradiol [Comamonas aquatica]MDH1430123.1 4,5-DOPA dioxygenase extradiol [Comamonas aquatica]MDH1606841.1 4,5-DOPA dioxygenase extradiol [Comamonas aquatica]MDH1618264.1 4,5-DOPA dioxygenase extradiol [Comamonas aquatica]MDH2006666.1 4,5-DOPA dioxygenase extradiol [Comamonas aquatica]